MTDTAKDLRDFAADAVAFEGRVMTRWDQIRQQCLDYKGSDLPRLNFEGLVEDFVEKIEAGADEIERLRGLLAEAIDYIDPETDPWLHLTAGQMATRLRAVGPYEEKK